MKTVKEKNKYQKPRMEITEFEKEDVITTSYGHSGYAPGHTGEPDPGHGGDIPGHMP